MISFSQPLSILCFNRYFCTMPRNTFTILLIIALGAHCKAQDFTYQHQRNLTMVKIRSVSFTEIEEPKAGLKQIDQIAPAPFSDAAEVKKQLDQQRQRRFSSSLHKYQQQSEDIIPEVSHTFDGLPTGSSGIPNDNNMAISNGGKVISVINSNVSIFNEDGIRLAYRTLENMVGGQLPNLNRTYDPKVVYDPVQDKFIMAFLQGSTSADTRIIVGFSDGNDPLGVWHFYAINGNPFGGKTWTDYPIIGLSKDDLYITVNILRDNESWQAGFSQSVIWQVDKTSGYSGQDSIFHDVFYDIRYNNKAIWSICTAPGGATPAGPGMHFLSVRPGDASNDTLFLHEITNTRLSGSATYKLKVLKTELKYGVPPSAFQPDASNVLQTNDTRVLSAMLQQNTIQYVQTSLIPQTGSSGIFHGIIDLASDVVTNRYIYSDTMDYAYPSIAFSGDADHPYSSVITFSHSSELDFPGTSVVFHNKLKEEESLYSPVVKIKLGDVSINRLPTDSNERWGDYTGIQMRYNATGEVWACGSYGKVPNRNSVWIGQVKVNNELNAIDGINTLKLYPNPANPVSTVRISTDKDQELWFELYSADGKLAFQMEAGHVKMGVYEFSLQTGYFRSGVYELVAYDGNRKVISSTKILIL